MGTEIVRYIKYKDNTGWFSVLNKPEAIEGEHHNPQKWSNPLNA